MTDNGELRQILDSFEEDGDETADRDENKSSSEYSD